MHATFPSITIGGVFSFDFRLVSVVGATATLDVVDPTTGATVGTATVDLAQSTASVDLDSITTQNVTVKRQSFAAGDVVRHSAGITLVVDSMSDDGEFLYADSPQYTAWPSGEFVKIGVFNG